MKIIKMSDETFKYLNEVHDLKIILGWSSPFVEKLFNSDNYKDITESIYKMRNSVNLTKMLIDANLEDTKTRTNFGKIRSQVVLVDDIPTNTNSVNNVHTVHKAQEPDPAKLQPCPACNSKSVVQCQTNGGICETVRCRSCGLQGTGCFHDNYKSANEAKADAIKLWNGITIEID